MRKEPRLIQIAWLILLTAVLAGCSRTSPARFYLLSDPPAADPKAPAAGGGRCITLGVGPVEIPEYLDRPQIVTQVSPNELRLGDFDLWAEPLAKTVMRALAENLAKLLCVEGIVFYPSESPDVDHQVIVTVTRFHGTPEGEVALAAQWHVTGAGGGKVLARKRTAIREPVEGQGYTALVAAHGRALARLSREIAETITTAPSP
ncbi:MAG: PqiC family protein [Syntrophobacteraceae bacterium]|nr:PqiC family protein [Syntrophobacteraceae bacterium]